MDMEGLPTSKLKLPQGVEGAGEIIDKDNFSVLVPLKSDESSRQFEDVTFGTYLDTKSPNAKIKVLFGKGSVQKSVGCSCDEQPNVIFEKLKNYLIAALVGSESSNPNREGAAREFCGCFKTGKFDDYIGLGGIKLKASDLKDVSKVRRPQVFLDKKLGWREITSLLRGEKVNGETIPTPFQIPDFGDENCDCLGSNTLEESIKNHVTSAIRKKKNILKEDRVVKTILSQLRKVGK